MMISTTSDWFLRAPSTTPVQLRLFCFPYAGGSASIFRDWSAHLPGIEVSAVQLPGRANRIDEPPICDLRLLVDRLVVELRSLSDIPFAFFGHSAGALIAYELGRELSRGHFGAPCHVFLSGFRGPHLPSSLPRLEGRSDEDLLSIARVFDALPADMRLDDELMDLLLPAIRADLTLAERYVVDEPLPSVLAITAFGGLADRSVSRAEIEAWNVHSRSAFRCHMFPGDHMFVHSAQRRICSKIVTVLREEGHLR